MHGSVSSWFRVGGCHTATRDDRDREPWLGISTLNPYGGIYNRIWGMSFITCGIQDVWVPPPGSGARVSCLTVKDIACWTTAARAAVCPSAAAASLSPGLECCCALRGHTSGVRTPWHRARSLSVPTLTAATSRKRRLRPRPLCVCPRTAQGCVPPPPLPLLQRKRHAAGTRITGPG